MTFLPMAYCTFRRRRRGCPCAHGKLRMPENTGDRTAAEAELHPEETERNDGTGLPLRRGMANVLCLFPKNKSTKNSNRKQ